MELNEIYEQTSFYFLYLLKWISNDRKTEAEKKLHSN